MEGRWCGKTTIEMLKVLFEPTDASAPNALEQQAQKIAVLTDVVFELLREVEALREATIAEARRQGISPKESSYGRAYEAAAMGTRSWARMSDGWPNLFARWMGFTWFDGRDDLAQASFGEPMRELIMMRRLGFSPEEIDAYLERIRETYANT
jgi:hypothetical protein